MKDTIRTPRIVLASSSPRRIELLTQLKLSVDILLPDADETPKKGEKPEQLVKRLSLAKALSVESKAAQKFEECIIIAADTIVVSPTQKQILGKPSSQQEAKQMLKKLAGKTHTVLTGYCLLRSKRNQRSTKILRVIRSRVKMRPFQEKLIDRYIATQEPMDKAGSYGAQGLGAALIEKLDGSYTNVVGLPTTQILMDLEKKFNLPAFSWISHS